MSHTEDAITFHDEMTLGEAREILKAARLTGHSCPCCDQYAKTYRRNINSGMAASLLWLVAEYLKHMKWVDMSDAPKSIIKNREIGKLQHWGLVNNFKGRWQPTRTGIQFALGKLNVPKYAFIYNNGLIGVSPDNLVSIQDCLSDKFSYDELMRGVPSTNDLAIAVLPEKAVGELRMTA